MSIEPIGGARPAASSSRVRRGQTGFAVPEQGEAAEANPAAAAAGAAQVPLLTLQAAEMPEMQGVADREAARQGDALLGAMRGLQLAMLGGPAADGQTALARLAKNLPQATDPGLDAVLQAIAQRVAVERARRT